MGRLSLLLHDLVPFWLVLYDIVSCLEERRSPIRHGIRFRDCRAADVDWCRPTGLTRYVRHGPTPENLPPSETLSANAHSKLSSVRKYVLCLTRAGLQSEVIY